MAVQVSILQGLFRTCLATLISAQWLSTAVSCFRSKDTIKYTVLVRSLQVFGHPDSKTTIILVFLIIPYPDFQGSAFSSIAVAELAYPVSFSPVVLPICFPSWAVQLKNTSCWVTGWDSGIYQYRKPSFILKELKAPLIDLQTCSDYYQKESLLSGVHVSYSEAWVNPGVPGQALNSIGNGDPLICKAENFWILAGMVSWGSNCIHTNKPGIYTNISFYKSWIEKSAISHTDFSPTLSLDFSRLFPVMRLLLNFLGPP
ncbi:LOW QUALITY PROTEIN: serine protease 48 [Molossus nigricans]